MIPGCTSNSEYAGALNIQIWSPTFRDEQQRNIHKQLHGCSFRLEQGWSTLRLEQGWSGVLHSVGGTERRRGGAASSMAGWSSILHGGAHPPWRSRAGVSGARSGAGAGARARSVGGTERSRRERGELCVVDLGGREDGVSPEARGHRRQELGGGEGLASTESVADLNSKVEA